MIFGLEKQICNVCGEENTVFVYRSFTIMDSLQDLDGRVRETKDLMHSWVHRCKNCGYTACCLDNKTTVTKEWILNYAEPICNSFAFKSEVAKDFYMAFLISKEDKDDINAAFYPLYSAWACDDAEDVENAKHCRKVAVECLFKITTEEQKLKEAKALVMCDLLRRAGCFAQAKDVLGNTAFVSKDNNKGRLFHLEKIKMKDSNCYTTDDVEKWTESISIEEERP